MRKLLSLLVFISGIVLGQEMDTLVVDTTKNVPDNLWGAYFEIGQKIAPNPPGLNQTNFIGGGIHYNRWSLGFLVYDFVGTTERFLIFPNAFVLKYRYGGPIVSFDIIQSDWISIASQASFSLGDMTWRNDRDNENFVRSEFQMLTLRARLEMCKLRYLRPYINAGYQQMSNLDLSGVDNEEFSGFFLGVGLRLGYFNQ